MRKPPKHSPGSLTTQALIIIIKDRQQWSNKELLSTIIPKYKEYDRTGLYHRMRQILYDLTKKGKLERTGKGQYLVK